LKYILYVALFINLIYAQDIKPFLKIDTNFVVKDLALGKENEIVIGTTASEVQIYNYKDKNFTKIIKIPKIKDFMGDTINASISCVDYYNGKYLMLSDSGIGGYSDLRINENNKTIDIFTEKNRYAIVEAKFIDDNNILLGFLSNEVALYNLKDKKIIYRKQLSESKFSHFALNKKRDLATFACESGEITVLKPLSGDIVTKLSGLNVDNIFDVDIKANIVSCAGKDRRASWYDINTKKGDYIQGKFFVYATALSPDGSLGAFALDEANNIYIYNLFTKSLKYKLIGQKSTLNRIIYKDDNTIFSASNDNIVIMWKLK